MKYIIETESLTKIYGQTPAAENISLHVPKGKIYGLLGRNGAGKTTVMRMLLNLIRPNKGTILLFGEDYRSHSDRIYRRIGSIIETPGFYENLTGCENLQLIARLRGRHGKDTVKNALEIVGLGKEADKTFSNYSLGMKQRLGIAASIMHEPELLILDEPINGLDPIGIHEIRNFLLELSHEKGTTILISSHVLSEIEQLADIIGVMHEGHLVEETEMAELHKCSRQYVEFETSDVNKAAVLLKQQFNVADYTVIDDRVIRIYDCVHDRGTINKSFVENGLMVTKVNVSEEKLEDYFSKLIGGGGIG